MYHFVALLSNARDPAACAQLAQLDAKLRRGALPWECLLATAGATVFALPPSDPGLRSYALPGDAGVVLGRLFRATGSNPHVAEGGQVDGAAARQMVRSAGQYLARNFWGNYVA